MLFAAGIHWGWFVAGITGVGGLLWIVITLTPYMTNRINLWLDPLEPAAGPGLSDGAVPHCHRLRRDAGPGAGEQHPEDAVYPGAGERFCVPHSSVEELGFVGGLVVLVLFALLILRGVLAGPQRPG